MKCKWVSGVCVYVFGGEETAASAPAPAPGPADWTHMMASRVFLKGDNMSRLPLLLLAAVTPLLQLAQPDLEGLW